VKRSAPSSESNFHLEFKGTFKAMDKRQEWELLATSSSTPRPTPTFDDEDGNCASSIQPDIGVDDVSKVTGYRIG
jgi:hypothetical protein